MKVPLTFNFFETFLFKARGGQISTANWVTGKERVKYLAKKIKKTFNFCLIYLKSDCHTTLGGFVWFLYTFKEYK